jgi:RNA polymerase primary sigma factor
MRQLKISKQITNRDSRTVDKYLTDISRLEMITTEQEIDLATRIQEGDQVALDKLVTANLRFVVSVAKQYQSHGLALIDLINEGNLGLIKAAKRFDHTRGFKFISYAVWWIRQSILQAIAENARIVRLPSNQISRLNKFNVAFAKLEQQFNREPTEEEMCAEMEITKLDYQKITSNHKRHTSLDAAVSSHDDSNLLKDVLINDDSAMPDENSETDSLKIQLRNVMSRLDSREYEVISMYFGLGDGDQRTLEDIADRFDLTRERVRQIKERALRKLRYSKSKVLLKDYL